MNYRRYDMDWLPILLLTLVVFWIALAFLISTNASEAPVNDCQEDEACWNCDVDGNQICGPEFVKDYE